MSQEAASTDDNLRPEYDFSEGVRGKHYEAYRKGTNVVFLDAGAGTPTASPPAPTPEGPLSTTRDKVGGCRS